MMVAGNIGGGGGEHSTESVGFWYVLLFFSHSCGPFVPARDETRARA